MCLKVKHDRTYESVLDVAISFIICPFAVSGSTILEYLKQLPESTRHFGQRGSCVLKEPVLHREEHSRKLCRRYTLQRIDSALDDNCRNSL